MKNILAHLIFIIPTLIQGSDQSKESKSCALPCLAPAKINLLEAKEDYSEKIFSGSLEEGINSANDNAFAIFSKILSSSSGNIVYSPLSLRSAFALLEPAIQKDDGIRALKNALNIISGEEYRKYQHDMLRDLTLKTKNQTSQQPTTLSIVNNIWLEKTLQEAVKPDYLVTIKKYYNAGLRLAGFSENPEQATKVINEMIELDTKQMIKNLIPARVVTKNTKMILTNTVYFKGFWNNRFQDAKTITQGFKQEDGSKHDIKSMTLDATLNYFEDKNLQSVFLPYSDGNFGMMIVLPKVEKNISDIDKILGNNKQWEELLSNCLEKYNPVILKLPKFQYEFTYGSEAIKKHLTELGGHDLFETPIKIVSGNSLYVTDVLQKAKIVVEEGGTEAAAATAVIIGRTAYENPKLKHIMTVDRPFLFFILDKSTQNILFMGRFSVAL